jgi:hypothetical protein
VYADAPNPVGRRLSEEEAEVAMKRSGVPTSRDERSEALRAEGFAPIPDEPRRL